ncbi:hypothetical protein OROGR_001831 [Orobanche gracilis]
MLKTEMNDKWRQWKSDLKSIAYDPSKTEEEVASTLPDKRVDASQYRAIVHHWFSESTQKVSEINRRNRAKFEDVHCMGTKSLPKLIDEKKKLAKGVTPKRKEIYIHTRTRKDGTIVNEKAERVIEELKKHDEELRGQMNHMQTLLTNVLSLIQNRFPGQDVNDIIDAARLVQDASSARNHLNSTSSNSNEDSEYGED